MIVSFAIDASFPNVYEGFGNYFKTMPSLPIISDALLDPEFPIRGYQSPAKLIFREDDFDLTARIRRGRFYQLTNGAQPFPRPVFRQIAGEVMDGASERNGFVYESYQQPANVAPAKLVALGSANTLWRVALPPERISTGELLFVLKARHSFGILPELDPAAIPEIGREKVIDTLDQLADVAYRGSPSSIADRARDAAQWCLATWAKDQFTDLSLFEDDLGRVIKEIEKRLQREAGRRDTMVTLKAAAVLQRFHSWS